MATEKFHFTAEDGTKISLPPMNAVKGGVIRRHRRRESLDFILSILEEIADPAELEKFDDLEQAEVNRFVQEWQESGGVTFPQS